MSQIHVDRSGAGPETVLLLHGLSGNAAGWDGIAGKIASTGYIVWAPDLPGHGRSDRLERYYPGQMAAALADALPANTDIHILAHSLGGVIGALLAGGAYGINVRSLFAFGVKLEWNNDERQAMGRIPTVRLFADKADAEARFLKVNGLPPGSLPSSRFAEIGISRTSEGFRLTADPLLMSVVGQDAIPLLAMVKAAGVPLMLANGAKDPLTHVAASRRIVTDAIEIPDAGHNPHVETPDALFQLWHAWLEKGPPSSESASCHKGM